MNHARESGDVANLLPSGAVAFEVRDSFTPDGLTREEFECVAGAVPKRINEFAAGRVCARAGLAALGTTVGSILPGPDRAPIWPPGFIGSISHVQGYCVAVVAPRGDVLALGVDAEHVGRVTPDLWPMILHEHELARIYGQPEPDRGRLATTIFSAKEAFYKCQYALTGGWLDFQDVVIEVANDQLRVTLVKPTTAMFRFRHWIEGRTLTKRGVVVCTFYVTAAGS